jgi:hypothetical protein
MKRRIVRKPQKRTASHPKPRYRKGLLLRIPVLSYNAIEFFPHAMDRVKQRGITRDEVIEAINNPTSSDLPTQAGRKRVRRVFGKSGKAIDVIYDELPDRVRVITTFQR